jgi:hypothetical protein
LIPPTSPAVAECWATNSPVSSARATLTGSGTAGRLVSISVFW